MTSFREIITMRRLLPCLATAGFGLMLAGCQYDQVVMDDYHPTSVEERFPIHVTDAKTKKAILAPRGTLSTEQVNALSEFAREARRSSAPKVQVLYPSGSGTQRQLAKSMGEGLVNLGIAENRIAVASYPGGAGAPIQLVLVRKVAVTRECGDWSEDLSSTSLNEPYTNFGCSTQHNIAALVANPEDLERPREEGPVLVANRTQVMKVYGENPSAGNYWHWDTDWKLKRDSP